jgi:hypothetical protein
MKYSDIEVIVVGGELGVHTWPPVCDSYQEVVYD